MKQFEEITKTESIFRGRILDLSVHDVRLPDGNTAKREVVSHHGAVALLPIVKGSIYFVRQYRIAAGKIMTEIPAGLLEDGEDPYDAAIRECREEIGLRPLELFKLGEFMPTPGYCTEKISLFAATSFVEDPLKEDPDEFLKLLRIPIRTARALFLNGQFTDGKTTAALGYYFTAKSISRKG
ncbi:NUDIX hydrolase [Eubacteriaceae bacterium ES3]|nr:NUDIX hydrolase [Eubacteriaceae bacterium ES3]